MKIEDKKNDILTSVSYVGYRFFNDIGEEDVKLSVNVNRMKEFFGINQYEAGVLAATLRAYLVNNEKPVSLNIVAFNDEINPVGLLNFTDEFKALAARGFFISAQGRDEDSNAAFYRISDAVMEAVSKGDKSILQKVYAKKDLDLRYPEQIKEKTLFYKKDVQDQIQELENYLQKDNFNAIQKRLEEHGMPKGVCIMLHGESGAGKTETVFQLAKKTNRPVYYVDIGSLKSMWVGGVEVNLRNAFRKYEELCTYARSNGGAIPILLFNEADALFGKRVNDPVGGSELTMNSVQPILLDYLERQSGIIFITTNIAENFDSAFERRFLYKVKYEKPDAELNRKIWKNKISWLTEKSLDHLSRTYSFTGGEIDNIVRKATINEVLTGKRVTVKELDSYCEKEKLEAGSKRHIGFNS